MKKNNQRKTSVLHILFFLFSTVMISGCDDEISALTDAGTGTLTLWTDASTGSCVIAVSVDGASWGSLSEYCGSSPDCGSSTSNCKITKTLSVGTHTVSGSCSSGTTGGSGTWNFTVEITSGGCVKKLLGT